MWRINKAEIYNRDVATTDVSFMLQLESTSIKNLTKILLKTNLYRASGRTRRSTDLLGHQKQGKYPINSAHIQDTSGVSQEAPFYCE